VLKLAPAGLNKFLNIGGSSTSGLTQPLWIHWPEILHFLFFALFGVPLNSCFFQRTLPTRFFDRPACPPFPTFYWHSIHPLSPQVPVPRGPVQKPPFSGFFDPVPIFTSPQRFLNFFFFRSIFLCVLLWSFSLLWSFFFVFIWPALAYFFLFFVYLRLHPYTPPRSHALLSNLPVSMVNADPFLIIRFPLSPCLFIEQLCNQLASICTVFPLAQSPS